MTAILRAALAAGLLLVPCAATAQGLSFSSKDPDKPITVTAEQGLEWQQNAQQFIARGNAKAVQGDLTVIAEELVAHYRDKPKATPGDDGGGGKSSEVYRVDAVGKVTLKSKDETATGETAVYDFDRKVLVLRGDPVTLTTADGVVTAHRALQYWSDDNVAVAEGDALAVDSDPKLGRRIRADKLTAYFRDTAAAPGKKTEKSLPSAKGRDLIYLVGAGNVVLTTANEVVRGDRANYNLDTGMATVEGSVKMTRDNNQLNGGYAVVNVTGGVSRLYGSAADAKGAAAGAAPPSRVRALLTPKAEDTSVDDALRPARKKDR
jgi:lipopolysaccharide export system protein LptA